MNIINEIKTIKYNRLSQEEKIIYNKLCACYKLELDRTYYICDYVVILYIENGERFILGNYYGILLKIFKFDQEKTNKIFNNIINNFLHNNDIDVSPYPYIPNIRRSFYIKI